MRFETKEDLENEERVIKAFTKGVPYKKLGENDIDFEIIGRAYAEVKCYKIPFNKLPIQILSLIKLVKLQECSRKLPTFFVCEYTDGIYYVDIKDVKGYVKWGGRDDPRKEAYNDRELVIYLPKEIFKRNG